MVVLLQQTFLFLPVFFLLSLQDDVDLGLGVRYHRVRARVTGVVWHWGIAREVRQIRGCIHTDRATLSSRDEREVAVRYRTCDLIADHLATGAQTGDTWLGRPQSLVKHGDALVHTLALLTWDDIVVGLGFTNTPVRLYE